MKKLIDKAIAVGVAVVGGCAILTIDEALRTVDVKPGIIKEIGRSAVSAAITMIVAGTVSSILDDDDDDDEWVEKFEEDLTKEVNRMTDAHTEQMKKVFGDEDEEDAGDEPLY